MYQQEEITAYENRPLPNIPPHIFFKIGGIKNQHNSLEVTLTIQTPLTTAQTEKLTTLIQTINSVNLDIKYLKNPVMYRNNIEKYTDYFKKCTKAIAELANLDYLSHEREHLIFAAHRFGQNTINQMPHHFITPGRYGHQAYEEQLRLINQLIHMMNHRFMREKLQLENVPFAFQAPQNSHEDLNHVHFGNNPTQLPYFNTLEQHLNENKLHYWITRFETYDADTLSLYFTDIITQLNEEEPPIKWGIIRKLKTLQTFITNHAPQFPVQSQTLDDAIHDGAPSPRPKALRPLDVPHFEHPHYIPLQPAAPVFDLLTLNNDTFNDAFGNLRDTLSGITPRETLLSTLNTLNTNLTELKTTLTQNLTLDRIEVIESYLNRCILRCSQSIPNEQLDEQFLGLQAAYENFPSLSRQANKLILLNMWLNKIVESPTKTYAQCLKEVSIEEGRAILKLTTEWRGPRMFGQHRFKDFITELTADEPDYDKIYPPSLANSATVHNCC